MIKALGAILIISGCAVSSYRCVKKMADRVRSLSSVTCALEMMRYEITERLTPMADVFEMMAASVPKPASLLFKNADSEMKELGSCSFYTIWKRAVDKTDQLLLRENEKTALYQVGLSLGRYDFKSQETSLKRAAMKFDAFTKRAEEERRRNRTMQTYLGVISGIFLVIVLL